MREQRIEERKKYAEFCSMNNVDKKKYFGYSTAKEFGEEYDVAEKTLSTWKKDPRFQKMKRDMGRQLASDSLPEVIAALKERAVDDKDVSAIREYLKYLGESIDRTEIGVTVEDLNIFQAGLMEILEFHIKDENVLKAIALDIEKLAEEL